MKQTAKSETTVNTTKAGSVRATANAKRMIKDIQTKAKKMRCKLNEPDIVDLALSLIKDSDVERLVMRNRKGRDRTSILKELWLKKNPKKNRDDFEDFLLTPGWMQFVEENRAKL